MPSLEAHLTRNEVMFRAINERIPEPAVRFEQSPSESLAFVCERADETRVERVRLTSRQYDDVRAISARFVFRSDRFAVVSRIGPVADTVRELS